MCDNKKLVSNELHEKLIEEVKEHHAHLLFCFKYERYKCEIVITYLHTDMFHNNLL